MPLNNKDYWEKRALLREEKAYQNALEAEKKLIKYYLLSGKEIRSKIADLYARYARDNKVSYAQAMEMLSVSKTNEWRYSIEEYVAKIAELQEANPVKAQILLAELNKLSTNARISRLAALTAQIDAELGILALKQEAATENAVKSTFEDSYYKTIFEVQQGAGYATTFSMLDTALVTSALNYPWSGLSYSERIWANRDQLSRELKQEITTGLIKGASIREMAEAIDSKTDKGYKNAVRLVRTEVNYFENAATMDGYKECDIDQYQYLATLDNRTSTICQRLDLKIFDVKDAMPGTNMPPMHPHCRSTTVPYFADDEPDLNTRIARDKDGKNIHVPANMTYSEWYNEYVKPYNIPTGHGNWLTNRDGIIVPTEVVYLKDGHFHPKSRYKPNAIVEIAKINGHRYRNFYDTNGFMAKQIHSDPHSNLKEHPFGPTINGKQNGQHAHYWKFDKNFNRIEEDSKAVNIKIKDRHENRDIVEDID